MYKSGSEHGNDDMLSRLPLPVSPTEVPVPGQKDTREKVSHQKQWLTLPYLSWEYFFSVGAS